MKAIRSTLVGRLGWLKTKGENVRVKIIAVNHDKPCHKCGGPWGTVETQGHAMVRSGMMSLAGTTAEGCLNDVKLDDDTAGTPNDQAHPTAAESDGGAQKGQSK